MSGRLLLPAARASWGMFLVRRPQDVLTLLGAPDTGEGPRAITRVLGGRHVAQAAVELLSARRGVRTVTAALDLLHSATGLALAVDPAWRRTGLTDAGIAAAFARASRRGARS